MNQGREKKVYIRSSTWILLLQSFLSITILFSSSSNFISYKKFILLLILFKNSFFSPFSLFSFFYHIVGSDEMIFWEGTLASDNGLLKFIFLAWMILQIKDYCHLGSLSLHLVDCDVIWHLIGKILGKFLGMWCDLFLNQMLPPSCFLIHSGQGWSSPQA